MLRVPFPKPESARVFTHIHVRGFTFKGNPFINNIIYVHYT